MSAWLSTKGPMACKESEQQHTCASQYYSPAVRKSPICLIETFSHPCVLQSPPPPPRSLQHNVQHYEQQEARGAASGEQHSSGDVDITTPYLSEGLACDYLAG